MTITFVAALVAPSVRPKISPVTVPATVPGGTVPVNENVKSSGVACEAAGCIKLMRPVARSRIIRFMVSFFLTGG